jgi:hypothetical protein
MHGERLGPNVLSLDMVASIDEGGDGANEPIMGPAIK